jgi:hypothetical protein
LEAFFGHYEKGRCLHCGSSSNDESGVHDGAALRK